MLKFSTYLRNALVAVSCLFGMSAQAQFSQTQEQYPTTDYSAVVYTFSLTEIATVLGTDTATLNPALREYIAAETPDPVLFYAVVEGQDVPWKLETEANAHGFWMTQNGTPQAWGEGCFFFASPDMTDAADDIFAFYCGQFPDVAKAGDTGTATLKLKFNGKEATFALTLSIIAKPVVDIPEPTTIEESKLNIVGSAEVTVKQKPRTGYDSDNIAVKLEGLAGLLGITNNEILTDAENLGKILYTTQYIDGGDNDGLKKDSLTNQSTAGAPGWWYRQITDAQGEKTGEASAFGWGNNDCFFIEAISFDVKTDTLTARLGQYPSILTGGEKLFANIYFIFGDKAYRLKVNVEIEEIEQGSGLDDYTKVGEEVKEVKMEPREDYSSDAITVKVDSIATLLGVETANLQFVVLDDKDNFANATANNGGWWFSKEGTVTSWGENAYTFIEPATTSDYSTLNMGQYPNKLKVGDEVTINTYFIGGENYYAYTIKLTIVEPQKQEFDFESVAERTFTVQQLLDNSYTMNELGNIAVEDIETLIGTASPVLYTNNVDSIAAVEGQYTKKYSCDPNPGFWMSKEGFRTTWGNNSYFGVVYADGLFRACQMPNQPSVGDVWRAQMFLVNEETQKMITVNIQVKFVETLEQKDIVGQENIVLPVSEDGASVEIDLAKVAEALSTEEAPVTVADLVNDNNKYLRGFADGSYGEAANCADGLSFASDGSWDAYGSIYFTIEEDNDKYFVSVGTNDEVADDFKVNGQFCFEVNNRQYVYYVTFASEEWIATGINTVKTADKNFAKMFDLQGREVKNAQRGLYIVNGKKLVVK